MKDQNLCFIGCGNMGRSLIGGLLADGYRADRLCGIDPNPQQREITQGRFGIEVYEDNPGIVNQADILVLAVKPQQMRAMLTGLATAMNGARAPLVISVAAGIRIATIERWLGHDLAVVRAMPNTPAIIRTGITGLYANQRATPEHRQQAESLLRSVGAVVWVGMEEHLDIVTALSGSGPAYFFLLMELLERAAVEQGLPAEQARLLTVETALGAARMVMESSHTAATLRQQVTSPGGTTEAALQVLTQGGIEQLVRQALVAARDRSVELADRFGSDA
jgi:pyrroline-5-carboxylate reductase